MLPLSSITATVEGHNYWSIVTFGLYAYVWALAYCSNTVFVTFCKTWWIQGSHQSSDEKKCMGNRWTSSRSLQIWSCSRSTATASTHLEHLDKLSCPVIFTDAAIITTYTKKGNQSICGNYRGISLLLTPRINLSQNNWLNQVMSVFFQKHKSVSDHLVEQAIWS